MSDAPVVAVHIVTMYQAVCHTCGWESPLLEDRRFSDEISDLHALFCEGPRPG